VRSPDRVQVLAGRVVRALGQVDQMVRDLLDTNRIRAGQQMSLQVVESLRLGALAKETAEQLASEYGKRFVVEVANDVVGAWSPDHVRRAIWNLATNAVKYGAPDTPVLITVGVSKAGYATLAVHNDGPPIRAEDAEHLFEPFRRAPAAPGRGWGLGLTLVRGVVEAHGGKVEVQSEPGKGTTFTLELPFRAHAYPQPEGDLP